MSGHPDSLCSLSPTCSNSYVMGEVAWGLGSRDGWEGIRWNQAEEKLQPQTEVPILTRRGPLPWNLSLTPKILP